MALWLNDATLRRLLPMADLIQAMRAALLSFSAGNVRQPVRSVIEIDSAPSFLASMPAFAPELPALGAKLVSVFVGNASLGLPSHSATVILLDPATGALLAVLDAAYITEARTAAVSALAVEALALPETPVLAVLGSGVQACSHIEALPHVRHFTEIRCWSPTAANLHRFCHGFTHVKVEPAHSAEAAVRGADVIVLATSSPMPVIQNAWVKEGACVISVGACRPNQRESDPDLVTRAAVYVDARASALTESGDIVQGIAEGRFTASHLRAELGELLADPTLGPRNPDEVILFKSLGLAVEDLAAAHLAYTRATATCEGVQLA